MANSKTEVMGARRKNCGETDIGTFAFPVPEPIVTSDQITGEDQLVVVCKKRLEAEPPVHDSAIFLLLLVIVSIGPEVWLVNAKRNNSRSTIANGMIFFIQTL